jgi:putative PIN family toxin of toxin-antitoxin system
VRDSLRLVLDTNVWLDWLVFGDPGIAPIKAAVAANRAEVFIDADCEAELERALGYDLGRRFTLDAAGKSACIAECRRVARKIETAAPEAERAQLPACRDRDDQKFMEAALAARAEFLVTKDRALLKLARRTARFGIVTPQEFADGAKRPTAARRRSPGSRSAE